MNSITDQSDNGDIFHTYEIILNEINKFLKRVYDISYTQSKTKLDAFTNATYQTTFDELSYSINFDSYDFASLIIELEDCFGIEACDDIVDRSRTVGDFIKIIVKETGVIKSLPTTTDKSTSHQPQSLIADLDVKSSTDENLGLLILPSLEEHGRLISIQSISSDEAQMFIKNFADKVIATRKVNYYQQNFDTDDVTHVEFFHNMIRHDELNDNADLSKLDEEFESLMHCQVPKTRGLRALFVSPTVIGIGTTVIFNKNWATINFEDYTLLSKVQAIAEKYFNA